MTKQLSCFHSLLSMTGSTDTCPYTIISAAYAWTHQCGSVKCWLYCGIITYDKASQHTAIIIVMILPEALFFGSYCLEFSLPACIAVLVGKVPRLCSSIYIWPFFRILPVAWSIVLYLRWALLFPLSTVLHLHGMTVHLYKLSSWVHICIPSSIYSLVEPLLTATPVQQPSAL